MRFIFNNILKNKPPIYIIYLCKYYTIINKNYYNPIIKNNRKNNLFNIILSFYNKINVYLLNRLDYDILGIIKISFSKYNKLRNNYLLKTINKKYICFLINKIKSNKIIIQKIKSPYSNKTRYSESIILKLDIRNNIKLCLFKILTGYTHQIKLITYLKNTYIIKIKSIYYINHLHNWKLNFQLKEKKTFYSIPNYYFIYIYKIFNFRKKIYIK